MYISKGKERTSRAAPWRKFQVMWILSRPVDFVESLHIKCVLQFVRTWLIRTLEFLSMNNSETHDLLCKPQHHTLTKWVILQRERWSSQSELLQAAWGQLQACCRFLQGSSLHTQGCHKSYGNPRRPLYLIIAQTNNYHQWPSSMIQELQGKQPLPSWLMFDKRIIWQVNGDIPWVTIKRVLYVPLTRKGIVSRILGLAWLSGKGFSVVGAHDSTTALTAPLSVHMRDM